MLPFLDQKKIGGLIIARKGKSDIHDAAAEVEHSEGGMDPALKEAAEDVLRAVEQKSVLDLAKALDAFFEIRDAMPHVEGEHEEIGE